MKKILTLFAAMLIFFSHLADAQVVLNEIKVRPRAQSSTPPNGFFINGGEEYVELYNNGCTPVNLNGYFIACRQEFAGAISGGTIRLPNVTIQPKSHLVIAPPSAAASENIDVPLIAPNIPSCSYSRPFSIPNIDGWVALYNASGTPIDGVYWSRAAGNINTQPGDFGGTLCVPPGSSVSSLPNAQQIGTSIMKYGGVDFLPNSPDTLLSRQIDGTGNWVRNLPSSIRKSNPTKNCNGGNCFVPTPPVTGFSYTPPTCGTTTATPTPVANFTPGGTYTVTSTPATGLSINSFTGVINISGSTPGTYTIRYAVTASGCSPAGSSTTQITIPSCCPPVPIIISTAPTCSEAGSSRIANYSSVNTYTFTPTGPLVGPDGVIIGMVIGTNYTVTAGLTGCTSSATTPFSNAAQLFTLKPSIACISSTTSTVTFGWNLVAGATSYDVRYKVNTGTFTTIQNITATTFTMGSRPAISSGDNVTIEVTPKGGVGTCFVASTRTCPAIACPPISAGIITGGDKVCMGSTLTLSNTTATLAGSPATGVWSSSDIAIATIDAAGVVTPLSPGNVTISYTVTSSTTGCPPAVETQLVTVNDNPATPTATQIDPTCSAPMGGRITITNPTGSNIQYSLNGGSPQTGTSFNNLASGSYSIIATNTLTGCVSAAGSFTLNPAPGAPNAGTIAGNASICDGSTTPLTTNGDAGGSWTSLNPNIATVDATTGVVTGVAVGTAKIKYEVTSGTPGVICIDDADIDITVSPNPTPEISWNGTQLFTTAIGDKYQWYLNEVLISGADSAAYSPTANGLYTVMVTQSGCSGISTGYSFTSTNLISLTPSSSKSLLVYPNPAQHNVWIKLDRKPGERMELQLFNAVGGLVKSLQSGQQQLDLNVADLPAGTYFIRVSAPGYREVKKIQIAR